MDSFGSRNGSYGSMGTSMFWWGEQAPTHYLDAGRMAFENQSYGDEEQGSQYSHNTRSLRNGQRHSFYEEDALSVGSRPRSIMAPLPTPSHNTIRFQVIVWSIACPDVKSAKVSMKFRVTIFWNDRPPPSAPEQILVPNGYNTNTTSNNNAMSASNHGTNNNKEDESNINTAATTPKKSGNGPTIWVMSGRKQAYQKKLKADASATIDIPPVSILNSDTFETIGQPEITLLRKDTKLMRWSCMYRAQLHQDEMTVKEFPHDAHRLQIKLGVLSQRQPGERWDRTKWKLALATERDTQGTIDTPHGLLVENVRMPEFHYDKEAGLDFDLIPLKHGSIPGLRKRRSKGLDDHMQTDYYLRTSLVVSRDSGYYDKNIMPLLNMLNLVAISILALDATMFFKRGLLALNIAFLEIGLRMTLDSKLPNVGYVIKIQRVLNCFFYSILWQLLESAVLHVLINTGHCSIQMSRYVDMVVAALAILLQVYLSLFYAKKDEMYLHAR